MMWQPYLNRARRSNYGETVEIPKNAVHRIPRGFEESVLSLPLGAQAVYRETKPEDTLQLREYPGRYTLQLDRYHPQEYPVKHLVHDVLG